MNHISGGLWNGSIICFEVLPSTNTWALENISNCSHGDIVWARHQTMGRGRFDRIWVTPAGTSLTISIILDISRCYDNIMPVIMPVTAIAVGRLFETFHLKPQFKWPNDILINGKKIAGILAEKSSQNSYLVLGIGLNVNQSAEELGKTSMLYPATSIAVETGRISSLEDILHLLVGSFASVYEVASSPGYISSEWARSDALTGRKITLTTAGTTISGTYMGINSEGQILIKTANNTSHAFWSGDVSIGKQQ